MHILTLVLSFYTVYAFFPINCSVIIKQKISDVGRRFMTERSSFVSGLMPNVAGIGQGVYFTSV